jgi:5-methylcytosine-specific restriction enzyme subunit McrC
METLSDTERNSGISQSDMYQMLRIWQEYGADRIVFLFPIPTGSAGPISDTPPMTTLRLMSVLVDLRNPDESLSELLSEVTEALKWIG